jgi:1-acyl-sn-glycerol-3-phosphate acyltransferase
MRNLIKQFIYAILVRPWLRLIIGVRTENKSALTNIDQFIIVANHNSHFDSISIIASLPSDKLKSTRSVASADYFGKTTFKSKLTNFFFNAILIEKKKHDGDLSAIEILDNQLKNGQSLLLFPEGSRGKPGVMNDFKSGIAVLLKNNPHIPFIPVYLDGFGRVLPKDKTLIIPMVCKVRFGEPKYIQFPEIEMILDEVKEAIMTLKDKDERDRNTFEF